MYAIIPIESWDRELHFLNQNVKKKTISFVNENGLSFGNLPGSPEQSTPSNGFGLNDTIISGKSQEKVYMYIKGQQNPNLYKLTSCKWLQILKSYFHIAQTPKSEPVLVLRPQSPWSPAHLWGSGCTLHACWADSVSEPWLCLHPPLDREKLLHMCIFLICLTIMAENAADLVINLVTKVNQTGNQWYLQHSLSHQHSVATGSVPATG